MPRKANTNKPEAVVVETTASAVQEAAPKKAAPALTPDMQIPCVSMLRRGELIYASKRTHGYKVVWTHYLDVQMVELSELVAMRSSDYAFFKENYITIPDYFELRDEVLKYLHVDHYYSNTPDPYAMNDLFSISIPDMVAKVRAMASSAKDAVRAAAQKAIADGELDSLKRITALEGVLSCKLT